jgi:hypothetical protein
MEVAVLPFDDMLRMVLASEIRDGMTVIAILIAAHQRHAGGL